MQEGIGGVSQNEAWGTMDATNKHELDTDWRIANKQGLYLAFASRDTRFDGRVFVGVSSTGIYCRPVCSARMPKAENCTFYSTAAEAESAGYRPCLLCRPELAPGRSIVDAKTILAARAAKVLEQNCTSGISMEKLAGKLGCTARHLSRIFSKEFNVSPIQYMQTCKLLLAKTLLTDTALSVMDVAMASGFSSLRRFNDAFKIRYRLTPTALRKQVKQGKSPKDDITITLGYRPPYQWEKMLKFLAHRAILGVEIVEGDEYLRTVYLVNAKGEGTAGWIRVRQIPTKNVLSATISATLLPVLHLVLARIRHLFDLHCDPSAVSEALTQMNEVRLGLFTPGLRVPGCFDAFEMCVRAVLGQQITVKAASTLAARIATNYGTPIETGIKGLSHTFPTPKDILALGAVNKVECREKTGDALASDELISEISNRLGPLGVTSARSKTILMLAKAFCDESIDFGLSAHPEAEIERLNRLPGIGNWTAQYIAMRSMGWTDAFLETDHGVRKVFKELKPKEILDKAQAWRPWRSYATVNIWEALGDNK